MAKKIGKDKNNGQISMDTCDTAAVVGSEANNYGADEFTVPNSRAYFDSKPKIYVLDHYEPDDDELPDEN